MKKMFLSLCILMSIQNANACAGSGLTKDVILDLMEKVEVIIKSDEKLKHSKIGGIVWADIKTKSGSEGDCQASTLTAKVSILAQNSGGAYCQFAAPVEIFQSASMGNSHSVNIEKGSYCRW